MRGTSLSGDCALTKFRKSGGVQLGTWFRHPNKRNLAYIHIQSWVVCATWIFFWGGGSQRLGACMGN